MVQQTTLLKDVEANGTIDSKIRSYVQYIHDGENELELHGFQGNTFKAALTWLGYLLTVGLLRLFFHWYPHLMLYSTHSRCSFSVAEKILIIDIYKRKHKSYYVEKVETITLKSMFENQEDSGVDLTKIQYNLSNGSIRESSHIRTFFCKRVRYVWDVDTEAFLKLVGLTYNMRKSELHDIEGYNSETRITRYIIYGNNEIDIPLESIFRLFILEALTPFYIFQVFSLIVWFAEYYYYYTIAIIIMSVYGISSSVIQTRKNQKNLRGTVHTVDEVMAWSKESNKFETIKSSFLVPGDVIVIPSNGCSMQCDAVLLNGTCIVNESMLTGESVPVLKTALEHDETFYNEREDSNHTLYCGTNVLQSRCQGEGYVRAVVLNTGFLTSKGELVRSIMYPPPADFKFDQDSYKFIGILAFIALLGFIYTVVSKMSRHLAAWDIIIKALDLITIVIPPALPAAMTIGKLFALNRLKRKDIYCINSRVINVSGSINCVCFDKTGTLTEDGLDMWGIVPINEVKVQDPIKESNLLDYRSNLLRAMSSCHSLAKIDDELTGDPLDFKMFESTTWQLKESENKQICAVLTPKTEEVEVAVLKRFQFSSTLQRMSVITQASDSDSLDIYCKGSPEIVMSLSKKETIPNDILDKLSEYTVQGYRVIAVGAKTVPTIQPDLVKKISRNEVESDLDFIGLLIFENKLKPQTTGVIRVLKNAEMKVVMITGDNIQTAISVAKECGLVEKGSRLVNISVVGSKLEDPKLDFKFVQEPTMTTGDEIALDIEKQQNGKVHFAVTGAMWSLIKEYFPDQIPKIITLGTVFARMSSEQKQQLILELQNIGYYVAMCGDGTNDCGALKAAHVGISLSEAESSVASPFTSKEPNISCVTEVVKEGRAALVTSFGVFKFMVCYSLTEFISVIILYGIDSNLTSLQFLFIDIFLALNFASIFGITEAYDKVLFKKPPATSLLGFIPIMSLTLHIVLVVAFQVISYYVIQTNHWFEHFEYDPDKGNYFASYENYSIFAVSMFQYIITAVVFSKGKPYRKPLHTNKYLVCSITLMIIICSYMTIHPANWILNVLEMIVPPFHDARLIILVIALANFFAAFVVEELLVDYFMEKKLKPTFFNIEKSRKKYLKIQRDLSNGEWSQLQRKEDFTLACKSDSRGRANGIYNEAFDIVDERT
ncbi:hypothetical protein Trydic_g2388 [Trypoxylus dichotomus]